MKEIKLVEKHNINKSHAYFEEIDNLAFLSKNLYNRANYCVRQSFIKERIYLGYNSIQKLAQTEQWKDYYALPTKVAQQVLRLLDQNWKSFLAANRDFKKNPHKYKSSPKLPKYKDTKNGRNIVIYTNQAISFKRKGFIYLSKTNIFIKTNLNKEVIQQVRVVPRYGYYIIEIVYRKEIKENENLNKENIVSIDLGVNNLITAVSTTKDSFIINGRPLKAINQYYNKKKASLQSCLPKGHYSSKAIEKLTMKRNNKINDYLHKASKQVIDYCLTNNIGQLVIGKNKDWKQNLNIGKKNNQTFVSIPFNKFIFMLKYKAELQGIFVIETEESYTSKCSFFDGEEICKHEKYLGKRIKRGLFRTGEGKLINADCNGALNILKKVFSKEAKVFKEIEGFVVSPKLLKITA